MNQISEGSLLPDWLRQRAQISPESPAIEFGPDRLSFAQLDERVDSVSSRLREDGITKGDRLAVLAANGVDFALAFFAASRLGACLVPLNTRLSDSELNWQITDCEPSRILTDVPDRLAGLGRSPPSLVLSELTGPGPKPAAVETSLEPGLPRCIFYTSGTTGRPKGAMLTQANFFWSAFGSLLQLGHQPGDRWLVCLPMFHIGGLSILSRGVLNGGTSVIHAGFDAERVNRAIDSEDITLISVVSTMLQRLLEQRKDAPFPPSLRAVLLGGGPVSHELTQRCLRLGVPALQTYGLTETSSQITTLRLEEMERKPGSAGRPLLPAEIRIENEDGSVCLPLEPGEICVRAPMVASGYFKRPLESAEALRGGWLHTGDLGFLDADGFLFVIDRRADLIVSGGENIYPAEVEAVLESHAAVVEAGVFALADREWGQRVAAAVRLEADAAASADQLQAYCRERLAAFKVPKVVFFSGELPRTASGKLQRGELRSLFAPQDADE